MRTSSAAQRRLQGLVYEALSYERMRPLATSVCGLKEYENKLRRSEAHVCVCVCVCVYTYIYMYLHIFIYLYMYIYVVVYIVLLTSSFRLCVCVSVFSGRVRA